MEFVLSQLLITKSKRIIMTEDSLKPYVIGLDLGGTNSVFGIVDSRGDIKATTSIKTQGYGENAEAYVDACVEALQLIIDQVGGIEKIKAMGIGAPNANYYNGTVENAANLDWARNRVVPLAKMFSDRLGIPVALTNDANAAAIGEMIYGVARGMKNFIVITLGTGVGSGIVVNGQLVYGSDGFAGELGNDNLWRHIARLRVWHVLHASSLPIATSLHYCATSTLRRLLLTMCRLPLQRATSLPTRYTSLPARFLERLVPTSLHSARQRLSSSSADW